MLRVHFCDYCDAYLVAEGTITVTDPNDVNNNKKLAFKIMLDFLLAFQKLTMHFLTMQKI